MARIINAFLLTTALLFCTCYNDGEEENKTIVIGKYYGHCFWKKCANFYKITNNNIYKDIDTSAKIPTYDSPYRSSSYTQLHDSVSVKFSGIESIIPIALINDTTKVYGEPDAGDWGGFYIEISTETSTRYFLLDNMKENLDSSLYTFHDELDTIIYQLNALTNK